MVLYGNLNAFIRKQSRTAGIPSVRFIDFIPAVDEGFRKTVLSEGGRELYRVF